MSNLLFGHPFTTPFKDELGMFFAWGAACRSSALGRQVGAAISCKNSEIYATGTNDVPKFGGGLYWEHDPKDMRDFQKGHDPNDREKKNLIGEIFDLLKNRKWLVANKKSLNREQAVKALVGTGSKSVLKHAQFMSLMEFDRTVHAEMAAITECACMGQEIRQSDLYTTTFPCHNCAKHIVASGIERVVYIEPYPKSLVGQLFDDSISIESKKEQFVQFVPFVGVSPRIFLEIFTAPKRKESMGEISDWSSIPKKPKMHESCAAYREAEKATLYAFEELTKSCKLMSQPISAKMEEKHHAKHQGTGMANARSRGKRPRNKKLA